jgi:hypothetical protein
LAEWLPRKYPPTPLVGKSLTSGVTPVDKSLAFDLKKEGASH